MKSIAYYRVSTTKQGQSGLGLEAQRALVAEHVSPENIVAEFTEVESGRSRTRPQLQAALAQCRATGARLVVAKLDRLARDATFLMSLYDSGVEFLFCDLPDIPEGPVGRFMLTLLAATSEMEAGLISQRTRAALAAAKARGTKLGGYRGTPPAAEAAERGRAAVKARARAFYEDIRTHIEATKTLTLRDAAATLKDLGLLLPGGKTEWTPTAVRRARRAIGLPTAYHDHGEVEDAPMK